MMFDMCHGCSFAQQFHSGSQIKTKATKLFSRQIRGEERHHLLGEGEGVREIQLLTKKRKRRENRIRKKKRGDADPGPEEGAAHPGEKIGRDVEKRGDLL